MFGRGGYEGRMLRSRVWIERLSCTSVWLQHRKTWRVRLVEFMDLIDNLVFECIDVRVVDWIGVALVGFDDDGWSS